MTRNAWKAVLGAALVALTNEALGQRAPNWRVYKVLDGLSEPACISVSFSPQGRTLARHLSVSSLSQLDGYTVTTLGAPQGSGRVYESPGGQLWTVAPTGLQELKDGLWLLHPLPEITSPAINSRLTDPVPLCPVRQGVVLCLLPDRLIEFNSLASDTAHTTSLRRAAQSRLESFRSMSPSRDGGLWIAGQHGLAKIPPPLRNLKPETAWQEHIVPPSLEVCNLQDPLEDQNGGVVVVAESTTNHQKVFIYFDGHNWFAQKVLGQKIRRAWRSPDGTWWAASINALFHSENAKPELVETEELSARQYFDVAIEPSGAFWLGTSDGLFRFAQLSWRRLPSGHNTDSLVHCLTGDQEDRIWFVSAGSLHLLQQQRYTEYPFPKTLDIQIVRSLFPLKDGTLLLESEEQLVQFHPTTGRFNPLSIQQLAARIKPLGSFRNGQVCLQRWKTGSPESTYDMITFDGTQFQPFPFPSPEPSIGSNFSTLFEAQNGDLWIGAEHGTAWFHETKWKAFAAGDKTSPDSPVSFLELADGRIWCATTDRIWQFDGRDWSEVRRGFDRINAIWRGQRDGSIWVASNAGLYRFSQGAWVENGMEEGLPSSNVRAVYEDQRGRLWAGTTRGLSQYEAEADRDPPQTHILPLPDKQKNIPEGGALTLSFSGQDKWKHTPRERLLYSYRLDGREWTPFQELTQALLTDLPAGKHYFQVRAIDRNCNVDPNPAQLEFAVALPWYRETRLVLIASAGVALALFFAGLASNRHRQLLRSYAEVEKKVTERTRELELASSELLHSQKMNALGTLAAGIAHDFNNILSIVKGSAQIIEDNLDDRQKVRTRLDRIKTVVEQGAGIVKAMLGFSRQSEQQPAAYDLNAVLDDTIKLLGDRFLREVQVSFQAAPSLPPVTCPKDFVQQIVLNFIFNAAESANARKDIILATRQSSLPSAGLVLAPGPAATYILASVQDFGCGIPRENMPRIFEPFFTTKALSDRRGTGLGLSMVYELAKKIGAGLGVESAVNKGSTFTLVLPVQIVPITNPKSA